MTRAGFEEALAIAALAHAGQVDRAGAPYILHVLRVVLAQTTDEARTVAALHDVVEDTPLTLAALADRGFAHNIVQAVGAITRRADEPVNAYSLYIDRVAANPLARVVKIADLHDNLRLDRIPTTITPGDIARIKRYHGALRRLTEED